MMLFAVVFGPVSWKEWMRPQLKLSHIPLYFTLKWFCPIFLIELDSDLLVQRKCKTNHSKAYYCEFMSMNVFHLPAPDRWAGLQATPQERLPPSSAEPPRRPAAASPPVCQTGTAPGPSAGCALPLQGTRGQRAVTQTLWLREAAPRRRTKQNIYKAKHMRMIRSPWVFVSAPLILSTVAMSSLRAHISALSSIGLPSFRLNFFRSALRRFFDDLLHTEYENHLSHGRRTRLGACVHVFVVRGDAGVTLGVLGAGHHAAGFRVKLGIRTVWTLLVWWRGQIVTANLGFLLSVLLNFFLPGVLNLL